MIPQPGQHVKCFLTTSVVVEGIVINWGKQVELQTSDGESIFIIHHPDRDLLMTKIILEQEDKAPIAEPTTKPAVIVDPSNDPMALHAKSMVELKLELAKQEKEIVAKKLRNHRPSATNRRVAYDLPKFIKDK